MAGSKPLIFMHFHEASFGNQHEIWSKQHNGKVTNFPLTQEDASSRMPFAFPHTFIAFRRVARHREDTQGDRIILKILSRL
jgi:hypothetical protein